METTTTLAATSQLPGIESLTADELYRAVGIRLYPLVEDFVVTQIGRITYIVSVQHGYAYTRPQLIQKYRNVSATYLLTPRDK